MVGSKIEIHNEEDTPFITVDFYTAAGDWCGGGDVLDESKQYRLAIRYKKLVQVKPAPITFYFETK